MEAFLNSINQGIFFNNIAGLASKFIHLTNMIDALSAIKVKLDKCLVLNPTI